MKKIAFLVAALYLLAACGEEKQTTDFSSWERNRLEYSYPYDGQQQVSTHSPIVLRFSHALDADADPGEVTMRDETGQAVPVTAAFTDDLRSIVLTPTAPLKAVHEYVVTAGELPSALGNAQFPDEIRFLTRGLKIGARDQVVRGEGFVVTRQIPGAQAENGWPLMDFSSIRLQFNQPLDESTVRYGETVFLNDAAGDPVPVVIKASAHYLTLDPVDDLLPGEPYQLRLDGVRSRYGDALAEAFVRELVPADSRPRSVMLQRAADSNDGAITSPLTGAAINKVPVNALLLGNNSASQQQGDVYAELAFIPNYPDVTPLRVARGSMLAGSSVEVRVAGEVPAGFETGDIGVTFVTDAIGYLLPNLYTTDASSPQHVYLVMDVAMTAANATANGALSQDLLHVELYGTAVVEAGEMVINAIGVVEPEVLGLETAWGVLSFNMRAPKDQTDLPEPAQDITPPTLQSWMPGDNVAMATPGEPIILNFSEPLDGASLDEAGAITLTLNGNVEPAEITLDGASVVIRPHDPVRHPRPASPANYQVVVDAPLRDIAGNAVDQQYILDFSLPVYLDDNIRSPIPLTVYPGYPCETEGQDFDPATPSATEHHGRCVGGQSSDDLLPLSRLPANRPIRVQFSQDMDQSSLRLGGSVVVEKYDGSGWDELPGHLRSEARLLEFRPDEHWVTDQLYRYRLKSNGDRASSANTNCDGSQAICSVDGLPLQTRWLTQDYNEATAAQGGGNDLVVYFRGADATTSILQAMRNLPAIDTNANLVHEAPTEPMPQADGNGGYLTPLNSTGIVSQSSSGGGIIGEVNVGCGFEDVSAWPHIIKDWRPVSCPENRYIYLTGALNAEVVGYDEQEGAVRVNILPTILHTSSLVVWANPGGIATILDPLEAPTGPQVMRLRYQPGGAPRVGWIRETPEGPILEAEMSLYLDSPSMHTSLPLAHTMLSKPLEMTVSGPIRFLEDGRMHIEQVNVAAIPVEVDINLDIPGFNWLTGQIKLEIPQGGVNLSFISEAVKR